MRAVLASLVLVSLTVAACSSGSEGAQAEDPSTQAAANASGTLHIEVTGPGLDTPSEATATATGIAANTAANTAAPAASQHGIVGVLTSGSGGDGWSSTSAAQIGSAFTEDSTPSSAGSGLDRETIKKVVKQNVGRIRICYDSALAKNPNLKGKLTTKFVIGPEGKVTAATTSGDIADQGVIDCVSKAFRGLTFPKPSDGKPVTISYPFVFAP
ncbi:MAG: AgmX/PglI C-terminal domain-containing protein [Polyangiaceae bacterium]|nr:AgmX/PglI C-terminal domain-containing protein [Polyangiaceae bacterium]